MKAIQAAGGAKNAKLRKTAEQKPPKEVKISHNNLEFLKESYSYTIYFVCLNI